jgi:K(+)-stimulated pyrophosphate-energized sodium pump
MRPLNGTENLLIFLVLGIAVAGLAYAYYLVQQILAESKGSPKIQEVWGYIRTGANAYLRSQFRILVPLVAVLGIVLYFSVQIVNPSPYAIEKFCPLIAEEVAADIAFPADATLLQRTEIVQQREAAIVNRGKTECEAARSTTAIGRALAFLMGAAFSATVGYVGMNMAVQGNVRVAAAALDPARGYPAAMRIAYRSGTITGMLTDGLGLFGGTIIFLGRSRPAGR